NSRMPLNKAMVVELLNITKPGSFLSNTDYEWLDDFKSEISNQVTDVYLGFARSAHIPDDPELYIRIADSIFAFDPVNEDAMILKCKALSYLGKHTLAKNTFEKFVKEYKIIYGEDFEKPFHAVVESH